MSLMCRINFVRPLQINHRKQFIFKENIHFTKFLLFFFQRIQLSFIQFLLTIIKVIKLYLQGHF